MQRLVRRVVLLTVLFSVGCSQGDERGNSAAPGESESSTVQSADGTPIGYATVGSGPYSVVIVHGVLDRAESWLDVAEALSEHCTCYVMDRRGRGRSGDSDVYEFDTEIEDIEAVLQEAGPDAFLLGHSSGAIYTLEAARRAPLAGLILYEPPLHYEGFDAVVDQIRDLVSEGRLTDAAEVFVDAPAPPEVAELSSTLVREWDAIFAFGPSVDRYKDLSIPTLLLAGSETLRDPTFATNDFAAALSNVRTIVLDGQGHTGNVSVPGLVAEGIADFLRQVAD